MMLIGGEIGDLLDSKTKYRLKKLDQIRSNNNLPAMLISYFLSNQSNTTDPEGQLQLELQ